MSEADLAKLPANGPYFPCDARIIEDRWMLERFVVHLQRYEKNPVIIADGPLDDTGPKAYGTALYDEPDQKYKIWYTVFNKDAYFGKKPFSYNICYAESYDGFT